MKVEMIDWYNDHWYRVEDEFGVEHFIASITSKLGALAKPSLLEWYGRMGTREAKAYMKSQGDRGTRIHHAWHVLSTGGAVLFNPEHRPVYTHEQMQEIAKDYDWVSEIRDQDEAYQIMKLKSFIDILKPEIIKSESIVYNIEAGDAGTEDNLFSIATGTYNLNGSTPLELEAGLYVFDLKTGSNVYDEAKMQISRYAMLEEMMGTKITGALIGHTGSKNKKGIAGFGVTYLNREDIEHWNSSYLLVAEMWKRLFKNTKPRVMKIPSLITLGGNDGNR